MLTPLKTQAEGRDIDISVTSSRIDFEVACIKSFQEIFPTARVECCFFHLAQVHWPWAAARYISGADPGFLWRGFVCIKVRGFVLLILSQLFKITHVYEIIWSMRPNYLRFIGYFKKHGGGGGFKRTPEPPLDPPLYMEDENFSSSPFVLLIKCFG